MAEGRGPRQALVAEDAAAYARSAGAAPCLSRCADHLHAPRSGGSGRQQLLARLEPDVPAERLCRPAVDRPRMAAQDGAQDQPDRSEEHTSELQSLMRISYAVFCLKKKNKRTA